MCRQLKTENFHGLTTIELFAGAGGSALGFENAGFTHKLLVENDLSAVATLKHNRPEWNTVACDVAEMSYSENLADVAVGGFPCQTFSYSGNKKGFEDTRGTMFFELARCVQEVQPKIVVAENVKGLITHDSGKTLRTIMETFKELGYRPLYKLLKSQYFDVPQKRERVVIIAIRGDIESSHVFPKEKDYVVTLREALDNVPESIGQKYSEKKQFIMSQVPEGGNWKDLQDSTISYYMGQDWLVKANSGMYGGQTGIAKRLSWDEPCLTLTCSPAQKQTERCHHEETRPLTVREYARVQTFPDDWEFKGSISSQYKQIGNAMPVNLAYHVAECVEAILKPDMFNEEKMCKEIYQASIF